ncbi:MAG: type I restriction enzyme HsdR N-terminal domain-containing protein [Rhodothermaceae bacterium]|nr:type I restriction enzyme HsdR N-terminal domain-containing protein [Rhodothermaceae bacterium]
MWVALQPEEWVRQHVLVFLMADRGVPTGLIAVEKGFTYQGKPYRADIIVHDREGKPAMMIECKAPEISISQAAFDQVATYNQVIRARYLYVTNGLLHFCSKIDWSRQTYEFISSVPGFDDF